MSTTTTPSSPMADTQTDTGTEADTGPMSSSDRTNDRGDSPTGTGRRRRRAMGILGLAVVSVGLITAGVLLGPTLDRGDDTAVDPAADATEPLPTETVTRGDLTETADATGTVGHGTSWDLPIEAQGVVTTTPDKGTVIEPGQVLLHVGAKPVHLAEGSTPLYRTLDYRTPSSKRLTGDDVTQLQQFLIDAGHDDSGRMTADGVFGRSTERAVKAWQKEQGLEQTGSVDRSQLVFNPGPVRIKTAPRVGADFDRLEVTNATQEVVASFDTDERPFVPVGSQVSLEADSDTTVTGTVTEVESNIDESGSAKLAVTITPSSPLPGDIERVKVEATRVRASDVLIAPVRAVVALASGGYGLEVDTPSGPDLRRVELGAVVDDRAEISGDFAEGDEVNVPRSIGGDQ